MKQICTHNASVQDAFAAVKQALSPIIERKNAILRTCGSEPSVTVDMETGAFDRRMASKPPRWIVRVEGPLDQPDDLTIDMEPVIGQYNLTQPVDIVVARVLFLHREDDSQPWVGFDQYECRLVVMVDPSLPIGSSSVALRICRDAPPANKPTADGDAAFENMPASDALVPKLMVTRRGAPAQTVSVHGALLICPPPESSEANIALAAQVALEGILKEALAVWPLKVLSHADDTATQIAFARVFDALEAATLIEQVRKRYAPPPTNGIDDAVYRRFSLALHAGFSRFVVVARDRLAGREVIAAMQTTIEQESHIEGEVPVFQACGDDATVDGRLALRKGVADNPAWILMAQSHRQADLSLEGFSQEAGVCTLVVIDRVAGRDLLQQAYRNADMAPPGEKDDLSRHLLFLTWQALERTVPDCTARQRVDALFQLCLRLAPTTSWEVPVDDPTRTVWEDAMALMLPAMLSGASQLRKERFVRYLGKAAETPESTERVLLQVL